MKKQERKPVRTTQNRQPKQDRTVHTKRTTDRQAQKSAQNRQAQQDLQAGNKAAASKKEETRRAALFAQTRRVPFLWFFQVCDGIL